MPFKLILFFILLPVFALQAQQPMGNAIKNNNQIKELFFAGLKDKLTENYVLASTNFSKIIALDPKNDAALFELASLNYRQNKFAAAETTIKKAIALNPNNIWYLKLLAEVYKHNGNMADLILVFNQLINLLPTEDIYYFDHANALFLAGKTDEALKSYDEIEKKFGPSAELTQAKQRISLQEKVAPTPKEIESLIATNPNDIKNYLFLSGVLLDKNKKQEAIALLKKVKTLAPEIYEIDLGLADIYITQHQTDSAVQVLKIAFENTTMPATDKLKIINTVLPQLYQDHKIDSALALIQIAITTHPKEAKFLAIKGDVFLAQNNFNAAKEQYLAALKINNQLFTVWEHLVYTEAALEQYTELTKTAEDALSIYPNQAVLYYYLAFALHRNNHNDLAAAQIKTAELLDADNAELKALIFSLQAEILVDQNKLDAADVAFNKAIALNPNNYLTLNNYAYYLALRNQDLNHAQTLILKVIKALPNNNTVFNTYALILFRLGQYEQAKIWIQKALENQGQLNPVFLEHYGDILFLLGEKELAIIQWQKAVQFGNEATTLKNKIDEKKYIK